MLGGTIKDSILYPEFYQYKYTKKKKDKNTQILFNNSEFFPLEYPNLI